MGSIKLTNKNFNEVLDNIKQHFNMEDKEGKKQWIVSFNEMLDELRDNDFFGTEGQLDPRGDNR